MRVRVEVCVTSAAEALAAQSAGADSIELCTWLAAGGVTPSYGMVNTIKEQITIPVRVLVRPRPGNFEHTHLERQMILRDCMLLGMSKVGLVIGALDPDSMPEPVLVKGVKLAAPECEITFHRAIDHAADPLSALEQLMQLSVDRILTSGGEDTAMEGHKELNAMVRKAKGIVRIAAAGGINTGNVVELVERTGVPEVHFSAQLSSPGDQRKAALSSSYAGATLDTRPDVAKIEGVISALVKAGLR